MKKTVAEPGLAGSRLDADYEGLTEWLVEVHDCVLDSVHLVHQPHDVVRQLLANVDHVVGRQQERLHGSLVVNVQGDVDLIAEPLIDCSLEEEECQDAAHNLHKVIHLELQMKVRKDFKIKEKAPTLGALLMVESPY